MYRVRVQFAAAATLLYALSAVPARAAVVTLDSQERVIEAHIALVIGFQGFGVHLLHVANCGLLTIAQIRDVNTH